MMFLRSLARPCRWLTAAVFGLSLGQSLHAQQTMQPDSAGHAQEAFSLGAYGGLSFTTLEGAFAVDPTGLLVGSDLCGKFERGTGTGPLFGLLMEVPLAPRLRLAFATEYEDRGVTMRYSCIDPANIRLPSGALVPAVTDHVAEIRHSAFTARLMVNYQPFTLPVTISAGPALSLTTLGSYSVREEIVTPASAEFVSGGQIRPYGDGVLSNGGPLHVGLTGGVSYVAPIGPRWSLRPEISYMLGLSESLPAAGITARSLRLTIGIMRRFDKPIPPAPEPIPTPRSEAPPLEASLHLNSVEGPDATLADTLHLFAYRTIGTRLHPLLTYLFFDKGSADIPSRYIQRKPEEASTFSESGLRDVSTLGIYYNVLDILGSRLMRDPAATIRVLGTEPDAAPNAQEGTLARSRAESVRQYLASRWKIEPSRIEVSVRHDPATPTNPETEDGAAENRRVEISSDSYDIMEPVVLTDTTLTVTVPKLRVKPGLLNASNHVTWSATIADNVPGGTATTIQGTGSPTLRDLPLDSLLPDRLTPATFATPRSVDVTFTAADGGRERRVEESIPIALQLGSDSVRYGAGYYSLILFDFGSSKLRAEHHRTIELVNQRTEHSAEARVLGYTDKLGEAEYNRRLSTDRANAVAALLRANVSEIVGYGKGVLLYDNTLPEGRFYSRSVTIETK